MITAKVTRNRFEIPEDGDVYDRVARHYIQRALWDQRMTEGRVDWADHDFALTSDIIEEPGVPARWGRCIAVCSRCNEHRAMYHGVDLRTANVGWCIPQSRPPFSWLTTLFGRWSGRV